MKSDIIWRTRTYIIWIWALIATIHSFISLIHQWYISDDKLIFTKKFNEIFNIKHTVPFWCSKQMPFNKVSVRIIESIFWCFYGETIHYSSITSKKEMIDVTTDKIIPIFNIYKIWFYSPVLCSYVKEVLDRYNFFPFPFCACCSLAKYWSTLPSKTKYKRLHLQTHNNCDDFPIKICSVDITCQRAETVLTKSLFYSLQINPQSALNCIQKIN